MLQFVEQLATKSLVSFPLIYHITFSVIWIFWNTASKNFDGKQVVQYDKKYRDLVAFCRISAHFGCINKSKIFLAIFRYSAKMQNIKKTRKSWFKLTKQLWYWYNSICLINHFLCGWFGKRFDSCKFAPVPFQEKDLE